MATTFLSTGNATDGELQTKSLPRLLLQKHEGHLALTMVNAPQLPFIDIKPIDFDKALFNIERTCDFDYKWHLSRPSAISGFPVLSTHEDGTPQCHFLKDQNTSFIHAVQALRKGSINLSITHKSRWDPKRKVPIPDEIQLDTLLSTYRLALITAVGKLTVAAPLTSRTVYGGWSQETFSIPVQEFVTSWCEAVNFTADYDSAMIRMFSKVHFDQPDKIAEASGSLATFSEKWPTKVKHCETFWNKLEEVFDDCDMPCNLLEMKKFLTKLRSGGSTRKITRDRPTDGYMWTYREPINSQQASMKQTISPTLDYQLMSDHNKSGNNSWTIIGRKAGRKLTVPTGPKSTRQTPDQFRKENPWGAPLNRPGRRSQLQQQQWTPIGTSTVNSSSALPSSPRVTTGLTFSSVLSGAGKRDSLNNSYSESFPPLPPTGSALEDMSRATIPNLTSAPGKKKIPETSSHRMASDKPNETTSKLKTEELHSNPFSTKVLTKEEDSAVIAKLPDVRYQYCDAATNTPHRTSSNVIPEAKLFGCMSTQSMKGMSHHGEFSTQQSPGVFTNKFVPSQFHLPSWEAGYLTGKIEATQEMKMLVGAALQRQY